MSRYLSRLAALIVLIVVAAPPPASAQGVGVGVKGGYLYSSLKFKEAGDVFDNKAGWMAGIFFGGNRPGTVGVMGELNLVQKRAHSTINDEDVNLLYLQVPVLLRVNAGSRSRSGVSVYGIAGPAFDFKIGDKFGDFDIVGEYEGFDVGLVAGLGVELTRIIIEGRGTWGFRNIAKNLGETEELKSRTFALLVGIRFN